MTAPKAQTYAIYMLIDPRDRSIRYIGMSNDPNKRYIQHIQRAQSSSLKDRWIIELLNERRVPDLSILEEVDSEPQARKREKYWIKVLGEEHTLFNFNLNTKQHDGGTRIDNPELAAHALRKIAKEVSHEQPEHH